MFLYQQEAIFYVTKTSTAGSTSYMTHILYILCADNVDIQSNNIFALLSFKKNFYFTNDVVMTSFPSIVFGNHAKWQFSCCFSCIFGIMLEAFLRLKRKKKNGSKFRYDLTKFASVFVFFPFRLKNA